MTVYAVFSIYGRDLDLAGLPVKDLRTMWRDKMQEFDTFMKRRPELSPEKWVFVVSRDDCKQYVIDENFVLQDGDRCELISRWPRMPVKPLTLQERLQRWFTMQKNRWRLFRG